MAEKTKTVKSTTKTIKSTKPTRVRKAKAEPVPPEPVKTEPLKIISLGGVNEIGKNLTVLEYEDDILVVDCGLGFPDDEMFGVDLVIPDVTYLEKNRERVRGFVLTHGHEDHIGGLPYVLQQVNAPIYATRLTAGLVGLKLEEHGLLDDVEIYTQKAGDIFQVGCFQVEMIHVNHSIADAVALAITCDVGTVIMTGDFKIDPTPIHGDIMDLARFGELGKEGVLALLCDSTNVEKTGYTTSEQRVADSFDTLFKNCTQRIIVTTFASNAHRIQSVINTAFKYGRKVAVTGRSMENIIKVSSELGYLDLPPNTLVPIQTIRSYAKDQVVIVTTGSQGENMSALYRMAFTGHRQVAIEPGDRIIISASAIPGNEKSIGNVIDELYRKGAEVIYNKVAEELHVSGHACQEELKIIHALTKPKYFIPLHGEQRHLQAHAKLARGMGMPPENIVITDIGKVIELTPDSIEVTGTVPSGKTLVDGLGVGDVGSVVLRDRRHLGQDGMVIVVAGLSGVDGSLISGPDIISRGFVYVKESEDLMEDLRAVVTQTLDECYEDEIMDWNTIKTNIKRDLSAYLFKKTKRNPMILPVIMEV